MSDFLQSNYQLAVILGLTALVGYSVSRRWRGLVMAAWLLFPFVVLAGDMLFMASLGGPLIPDWSIERQVIGLFTAAWVLCWLACSTVGFAIGSAFRPGATVRPRALDRALQNAAHRPLQSHIVASDMANLGDPDRHVALSIGGVKLPLRTIALAIVLAMVWFYFLTPATPGGGTGGPRPLEPSPDLPTFQPLK